MPVWTRSKYVSIYDDPALEFLESTEMQMALCDGISRKSDVVPSEVGLDVPGVSWHGVRSLGESVGVVGLRSNAPFSGATTLIAVAIIRQYRGNALGTHSVLAVARKMKRDGVKLYGSVPRTNGSGLYFWLRCGYAPITLKEGASGETLFRKI